MRITADTNLLVRVLTRDDPQQAPAAEKLLREADRVAITVPALCEVVWVLTRGQGLSGAEVASGLRLLLAGSNVVFNRAVAEAGLLHLEAGGDFADGVIAMEGAFLGGEVFASFDRQAVKLLEGRGQPALLLGP